MGGGDNQKKIRSPNYFNQCSSLITNINFFLVKSVYSQEVLGPFDFDLVLKIEFVKISKINVESSLIVHPIGSFIEQRQLHTHNKHV